MEMEMENKGKQRNRQRRWDVMGWDGMRSRVWLGRVGMGWDGKERKGKERIREKEEYREYLIVRRLVS